MIPDHHTPRTAPFPAPVRRGTAWNALTGWAICDKFKGMNKTVRMVLLAFGTRGVIPKQEFLDRWHDYTGEPPFDPTDRAYVRLGIFITGKTPVRQFAYTKVD